MPETLAQMAHQALGELARIVDIIPTDAADPLIEAIFAAKSIAIHGLGREGLQMRGLAMRLSHLGLDAHVVGDMTTPPLGERDLLIVSAGPGDFATINALMEIACTAGARTAVVTAQPESAVAKRADAVLCIPAQTMADDQGEGASVLPMGSLFEMSEMLLFELIVLRLRERLGETPETMRRRHTNLE
jgi:6-phospho-3-hexuloisomerase